jgi:hypothetical protein
MAKKDEQEQWLDDMDISAQMMGTAVRVLNAVMSGDYLISYWINVTFALNRS